MSLSTVVLANLGRCHILGCYLLATVWLSSAHEVDSFSDLVPGGNYSYYLYYGQRSATVLLKTIEGDADLYVSQTRSKPTFDVGDHDLQSTTCGVDVVFVPETFRRPVAIGVYGHPSHEESVYKLEILANENDSGSSEDYNLWSYDREETSQKDSRDNELFGKKEKKPSPKPKQRSNESPLGELSYLWDLFINILGHLAVILSEVLI